MGQSWALRVAVDTRALKDLTAGARKIEAAASAIDTLNRSLSGVGERLASEMNKASQGTASSIANLKKELSDLKGQIKSTGLGSPSERAARPSGSSASSASRRAREVETVVVAAKTSTGQDNLSKANADRMATAANSISRSVVDMATIINRLEDTIRQAHVGSGVGAAPPPQGQAAIAAQVIRTLRNNAPIHRQQASNFAEEVAIQRTNISQANDRLRRQAGVTDPNQLIRRREEAARITRQRDLENQVYGPRRGVGEIFDSLRSMGIANDTGKGRSRRMGGFLGTMKIPDVAKAFQESYEMNAEQYELFIRKIGKQLKDNKYTSPDSFIQGLKVQAEALGKQVEASIQQVVETKMEAAVKAVKASGSKRVKPAMHNKLSSEELDNLSPELKAMIAEQSNDRSSGTRPSRPKRERFKEAPRKQLDEIERLVRREQHRQEVVHRSSNMLEYLGQLDMGGITGQPADKQAAMVQSHLAQLDTPSDPVHAASQKEMAQKIIQLIRAKGGIGKAMPHINQLISDEGSSGTTSFAGSAPTNGGNVRGGWNGVRLGGAPSRFKESAERLAMYGGAGAIMFGGVNALQGGVKTMTDFEDAMNRVRKVANPLGTDMKSIGDAAKQMAQEFGASTIEVAQAMEIYAQQGRSQSDIISQTRTAMLAANVTDLSMVDATEALTAAQKQFQLSSQNSLRVLDAWNEVENVTSVNAKVLTEALKNAGTVARLSGVDFDTFNGIVAAVGEATRKSGEEIGTSLKFIFQNSRSQDAIEALQEVGVLTVDAAGGYKSFKLVLGELSGKWDKLTDAEKQNIGVKIAGVRRLNDFFVMMDHYKRAQDIALVSMSSAGSAARENEIAMGSLKKQIEQLKASYDSLWESIGESGALDALKQVTTTAKGLLGMVGGLNKGAGNILGGPMGFLGAGAIAAGPLMGMMPGLADSMYSYVPFTRRDRKSKGPTGNPVYDDVAVPNTPGGKTSPAAGMVGSRQPYWTDGRRRMASGAVMLAGHMATSYWDRNYRNDASPSANTAVDMGSTALDTTMLGSMLWSRRAAASAAPGKGMLGTGWNKFKAQGKIGKAGLALLLINLLGQGYNAFSSLRKQTSKDAEVDSQLGGLRSMEEFYTSTQSDLGGILSDQKSGQGIGGARTMMLHDALLSADPMHRWGGDTSHSQAVLGNEIDKLRGGRTAALDARVSGGLESKEVRDALKSRGELLDKLGKTTDPKQRAAINGQLSETVQVLERYIFQPLKASATNAGLSSRQGKVDLSEAWKNIQATGQATAGHGQNSGALTDELAKSYIKDFIEASTGESVNVGEYLKKSGQTTQGFFENPEIKSLEKLPDVIQLSSRRIVQFVSEYAKAIDSLIKSNEEVLSSQAFVGKNLEVTGHTNAEGRAKASYTELEALGRIEDTGVKGFGETGSGDPNEHIATRFRRAIGEAQRMGRYGNTIGLEGFVRGESDIGSFMADASGEAERQVNALIKNHKLDPKAMEGEVATNYSRDKLTALLGGDTEGGKLIGEIEKALADASRAKDEGERDRLIQQARDIASGGTRNDANVLIGKYHTGGRALMEQYRTGAGSIVNSLAELYSQMRHTGQVGSIGEFMARPEATRVTGQIADRRDTLSRVRDIAAQNLSSLEKNPEDSPAYREKLGRAKQTFDEVNSAVEGFSETIRDMDKKVEELVYGLGRLDIEMAKVTAGAKSGSAVGLTGNNATRFGSQFYANAIKQVAADPSLGKETREKLIKAYSDQQTSMEAMEAETRQTRDLFKKNFQSAALQSRFSIAAGLGQGAGIGGYLEAAKEDLRETVQKIVTANEGKLKGSDEHTQAAFGRDLREALKDQITAIRDLELASDPQYAKDYLMSTSSQRAMADQVRSSLNNGSSVEEIFSDPSMRMAAQDNPLLQRLMQNELPGMGLLQKAQETNNDLTKGTNDRLDQLLQGKWASSHAAGTTSQRGTKNVDSQGRINKAETVARLHHGEIVLNKQQAEEYLSNSYASGTMPDRRLRSDLRRLQGGGWSVVRSDGGYGMSHQQFGGQMQVRPEATLAAAIRRGVAQDSFMRNMGVISGATNWADKLTKSNNPLAAAGHGAFRLLANGANNKEALNFADLKEVGKNPRFVQRLLAHTAKIDPLNIGSTKMQRLLGSMNINVGDAGGAGAQHTHFMDDPAKGGVGGYAHIQPSQITMDKLYYGNGTKFMNVAGNLLGHEAGHELSKTWSSSVVTSQRGLQSKVSGRLLALTMDNRDPGMALARQAVFHNYGYLREAFEADPKGFMQTAYGRAFAEEVLNHRIQIPADQMARNPHVDALFGIMDENHAALGKRISRTGRIKPATVYGQRGRTLEAMNNYLRKAHYRDIGGTPGDLVAGGYLPPEKSYWGKRFNVAKGQTGRMFSGLGDRISGLWGSAREGAGSKMGALGEWLNGKRIDAKYAGRRALGKYGDPVANYLAGDWDYTKTRMGRCWDKFNYNRKLYGSHWQASDFRQGLGEAAGQIARQYHEVVDPITGAARKAGSWMGEKGRSFWEGTADMREGMGEAWGNVKGQPVELWKSMGKFGEGAMRDMNRFGRQTFVNPVKQAVRNIGDWGKNTKFGRLVGDFVDDWRNPGSYPFEKPAVGGAYPGQTIRDYAPHRWAINNKVRGFLETRKANKVARQIAQEMAMAERAKAGPAITEPWGLHPSDEWLLNKAKGAGRWIGGKRSSLFKGITGFRPGKPSWTGLRSFMKRGDLSKMPRLSRGMGLAMMGNIAAKGFGYDVLPDWADHTLNTIGSGFAAQSGQLGLSFGMRSGILNAASESAAAGGYARTAAGLTRLNSGISRVSRFGGKAMGLLGATQMAIDVNRLGLTGLHKLGWMGDGTYKNYSQSLNMFGEGTGIVTDLLSGEGRRDWKPTWNIYKGQVADGKIWSNAYQSSYAGIDTPYWAAGEGLHRLFSWQLAKEELQQQREAAGRDFYANASHGLNAKILSLADPNFAASSEANIDKALAKASAGDPKAKEDPAKTTKDIASYQSQLNDELKSAKAMQEQYAAYSGNIDRYSPESKVVRDRQKGIAAYVKSLETRQSDFEAMRGHKSKAFDIYAETMRRYQPDAFSKIMGSGANKGLSALAKMFGVDVPVDTLNLYSSAAGRLPGSSTMIDLFQASGTSASKDQWNALLNTNSKDYNPESAKKLFQQLLDPKNAGWADANTKDPSKFASAIQQEQLKDLLDPVRDEINNFGQYDNIAKTLKPRVQKYHNELDSTIKAAQSLADMLKLPDYTPGMDTNSISALVTRYQKESPGLLDKRAGLTKDFDGLTKDYGQVMELYDRLPSYVQKRIQGKFRGKDAEITAARLTGVDAIRDPSGLEALLGPAGSITLWGSNAQSLVEKFQSYNAAWADAKGPMGQLAGRDEKHQIEELIGSKKTRSGRIKGSKDDYVAGAAFGRLLRDNSVRNSGIGSRETIGRNMLRRVEDAYYNSDTKGGDGYLGLMDQKVQGLGGDVRNYGSIADQIAAAKSGGDQLGLAKAEKAKAEMILSRDYTEDFYKQALQQAHTFEERLNAKSDMPGKAVADARTSGTDETFAANGQLYRRVGDKLVPITPPKRHAGGPLGSGETVIQGGGQGQEWVTPAVMAKRFSESVQGMEELISKANGGGPDFMTSDARQFMGGGNGELSVSGTVSHNGEITLSLGCGVEELLRQLAQIVSQNSKGASVRVGDKVLRPVAAG